jgi:hypothetical protein
MKKTPNQVRQKVSAEAAASPEQTLLQKSAAVSQHPPYTLVLFGEGEDFLSEEFIYLNQAEHDALASAAGRGRILRRMAGAALKESRRAGKAAKAGAFALVPNLRRRSLPGDRVRFQLLSGSTGPAVFSFVLSRLTLAKLESAAKNGTVDLGEFLDEGVDLALSRMSQSTQPSRRVKL